ncbi:MAG TPA: hypothetical protein VGB76_02150 [Pyrinomonadaceae bacterium]|jgi:hypothetical protein
MPAGIAVAGQAKPLNAANEEVVNAANQVDLLLQSHLAENGLDAPLVAGSRRLPRRRSRDQK